MSVSNSYECYLAESAFVEHSLRELYARSASLRIADAECNACFFYSLLNVKAFSYCGAESLFGEDVLAGFSCLYENVVVSGCRCVADYSFDVFSCEECVKAGDEFASEFLRPVFTAFLVVVPYSNDFNLSAVLELRSISAGMNVPLGKHCNF